MGEPESQVTSGWASSERRNNPPRPALGALPLKKCEATPRILSREGADCQEDPR